MDSNSLIESLTAHIALYHSSTPSKSFPPNPRASILRWFSSLTVHQRQSSLTVVDSEFCTILLQMQEKLRGNGHCCFIILPDLPSTDHPSLPSLCFRRTPGLLARVRESNESERAICDALRLFTSGEGDEIDSVTVSEDFVGHLDRFVAAMDGVSNGGFLRGEESVSGSCWEELAWLKAKGYYSIEAFVANKLELALRLSWLNCNGGGKKRGGGKLKERLNVAGVAANVYWRKKGCVDWWVRLDPGLKNKIFRVALGKSAKFLTNDIVKAKNSIWEGKKCLYATGAEQLLRRRCTLANPRAMWPFSAADVEFHSLMFPVPSSGKPSCLFHIFYSLAVLQEISAIILAFEHNAHENDKLFFSTLCSVHTMSDSILRKLRGMLMLVSSDSVELELLEGDAKSPLNKSKRKHGGGNRGKGKSRHKKKLNSALNSSEAKCRIEKPGEDHLCDLAHKVMGDLSKADAVSNGFQGNNILKTKHFADVKVQTFGKRSKKKCTKADALNSVKPVILEEAELRISHASQSVSKKDVGTRSDGLSGDINNSAPHIRNNISISSNCLKPESSACFSDCKPSLKHNEGTQNTLEDFQDGSSRGRCCDRSCILSSGGDTFDQISKCELMPYVGPLLKHQDSEKSSDLASQPCICPRSDDAVNSNEKTASFQRLEFGNDNAHGPSSSLASASFEWPSVARVRFPSINAQYLPATTDRLHLDVGRNWRNHFHQSFVSTRTQTINPSIESTCSRILAPTLPTSFDWPPIMKSASRLSPSIPGNCDSGFIPRLQLPYRQGFTPHGLQVNGTVSDEERKYSGEVVDSCDFTNMPEFSDDAESHWISEEEFEVRAFPGRDYNQYFGGGVMYWNTSDHVGTGFSRAPSLSSEDSSWAWHEADLNKAIDDMVGFTSSYSTNGLTSPPASSFCSPFDPIGPGQQALGYVMQGSDVTGTVLNPSTMQTDGVLEESVSASLPSSSGGVVEGKIGDPLSYPILRPIIIPDITRKGSRSEFKPVHDRKSPCLPLTRSEQPRIKRPPSPVVLCVPRAPCPPPPSPVGESRRRRGFPTVRSGSSSPRHWGLRSWFHDGTNCEESGVCLDNAEVVWPSWRNKGLSSTPMIQPLPGTLIQDSMIAMSQLALDQEHPDVALPLQPPELQNCPARKVPLSLIHNLLHDEIDSFCKQVAAKNLMRKPYINWAVKRVARSLQVLWPRSRTNVFGSNTTGLSLPSSDVDLVVCLPPVRNLEPIKEAGILEGRNGIKETCIQHAARYLANQDWVKNDSLKTVENTAIPIIMLVAEVPRDVVISGGNASNEQIPKVELAQEIGEECNQNYSSENSSLLKNDEGVDVKSVRLDISFKSPSHTGLLTTELVRELTKQFPVATPLALVLKQFLADRSLDHSYSGGLSSYCLILLITRFLQHEHHLGRFINQNLGSLLMDFLYFFGNVFDPRQMRISIQGSGIYLNRERGHSIDPIHIDDPLFPMNNVGRNCFRIHQCIKAFADAYSTLESELEHLPGNGDPTVKHPYRLLPKIIPTIDHM